MESSINTRVFKMILVLLALLAVVGIDANPLLYTRDRDARPERNETPGIEIKKDPLVDHFDQRQNGSENYRVKVDGLVFILAPADTLLLGAAAMEPNFTSLFSDVNKPKPKPGKEDMFKPSKFEKDEEFKSANVDAIPHHASHKPSLRISNLIAPFLNRIRHAQQAAK